MNNIDKQYTDLLQDILDNGVEKKDRTGTGTISVFGRQIRHKMSEGFPLLTTKKMAWKSMVTELIWFLRGDTNIKYLVDNGCMIWVGDAYKNYLKKDKESFDRWMKLNPAIDGMWTPLTEIEFVEKIKTDEDFSNKYGDLGPIYGAQWRYWQKRNIPNPETGEIFIGNVYFDQIRFLINELKNNPDSRRLMVNAWNVGELDQMVLPPCHYGFQIYTRELTQQERLQWLMINLPDQIGCYSYLDGDGKGIKSHDFTNVPERAISLMWNQRSVDTFLGLPFNIASYGLLLEIIAKELNMVPDELIGNLGDVHLYSNHVEQAKEQIGRKYTYEERIAMIDDLDYDDKTKDKFKNSLELTSQVISIDEKIKYLDRIGVPIKTREPFPLSSVKIDYEGSIIDDINKIEASVFILENYQSHSAIKAPLSN